jgi:hypothetical protein
MFKHGDGMASLPTDESPAHRHVRHPMALGSSDIGMKSDPGRDALGGLGEAVTGECGSCAVAPHRVASGMPEGEGGAVGAAVVSSAR